LRKKISTDIAPKIPKADAAQLTNAFWLATEMTLDEIILIDLQFSSWFAAYHGEMSFAHNKQSGSNEKAFCESNQTCKTRLMSELLVPMTYEYLLNGSVGVKLHLDCRNFTDNGDVKLAQTCLQFLVQFDPLFHPTLMNRQLFAGYTYWYCSDVARRIINGAIQNRSIMEIATFEVDKARANGISDHAIARGLIRAMAALMYIPYQDGLEICRSKFESLTKKKKQQPQTALPLEDECYLVSAESLVDKYK
jgi:hypothetical protein